LSSRDFKNDLLAHGFTFAVALAVIILLVTAVTAIWEKLRDDRESKKLEREPARAVRRIGLKVKNPKAPAVKLETEEDRGH
jgi:hypothetical protein